MATEDEGDLTIPSDREIRQLIGELRTMARGLNSLADRMVASLPPEKAHG